MRQARGIRWALTVGVAMAAAGVAATPVLAAGERIAPAAHVQATVLPAGAAATIGPVQPRAIPLLVRNPAAYARAQRAAAATGKTESIGPLGGAPATAATAQTAVVGTLNAPGLSAAQQISAFGEAGDTTPPDTTGAIGPADYVEMVNAEIAVYNRTDLTQIGSLVGVDRFTGGVSPCDVQVKYDTGSDRWFYVALRCDGTTSSNELYVGWSKTNDPSDLTGGWCRFSVASTPATALDDYPKLGIDGSHVIIGANTFDASTGDFDTAHILVAAKPPTGALSTCDAPGFSVFGSAVAPLMTSAGNLAFTPQPATVSDTTSATGYLVAADLDDRVDDVSGTNLMVWQIGDSSGMPTLIPDGDVGVGSFAIPPPVRQPGTADTIDPLDSRLTQAVAAADPSAAGAEAIWTQHTVADGRGGAVVRWYELLPSTMTLRQSGTIGDAAGFAFNGAIAPTLNGGAVINYDAGGPQQQVQLKAQSRLATDPLGTMSGPVTLASSSAIDSDFSCPSQPFGAFRGSGRCRWGDYAGASVDPLNGDLVWGSNQVDGPTGGFIFRFGHQAQWRTENFALMPTATPAPTASFAIAPNAAAPLSTVSFDGSSSSDAGDITDYRWSFGDGTSADLGSVTVARHAYASPGLYTVQLTVTHSGGRTATATQTLAVDQPSASFTMSSNQVAPGTPIGFNASGSSDAIGAIVSYSWNFGDGTIGSGATPTHAFATPGNDLVTLTVTNSYGQVATAANNVIVNPPPTPVLKILPNPALIGSAVTFDASASSHPFGTSASYTWSFGDGGGATGAGVTHSYVGRGTYAVTLTVLDSDGQADTSSANVVITPPRLTGQLSIPRGQTPATMRRQGLKVSLTSNQGNKAAFTATATIKPTRRGQRSSVVTLLKGRTLTLRPGRNALTLKLNAAQLRKLPRGRTIVLSVSAIVTDTFAQTLTPRAKLTLKS